MQNNRPDRIDLGGYFLKIQIWYSGSRWTL